ncbi:hypothetical protein MTR67_013850 [Solanum verrucosum]|uniref:Uncharacterized protein n=1 Tax=Solanum verrucosum TaxID=315347 RepID=A0AAF0QDW6_SOLVR|nr:hypothetical protein MTR67_013850 [Solanum verrucosum]
MPRSTSEVLACSNRNGNLCGHKERWKIVSACISGQNGRREIRGVLKIFPDVEKELLGDFLFLVYP